MTTNILIVARSEAVVSVCDAAVQRGLQNVRLVPGLAEAVNPLETGIFDAIIVDMSLPISDVVSLTKKIRFLDPDAEIIMVAEPDDVSTVAACTRSGVYDLLAMPLVAEDIELAVKRALERRHALLKGSLLRVSEVIFAAPPDRLPEILVGVAMHVMNADDASLMIPDAEGHLRMAYSHGLSAALQQDVRVAMGDRIAGRVAASGEPLLLNGHPLTGTPYDEFESFGRARSSIIFPLKAGGQLVGVLNLSRSKNEKPFGLSDMDRAAALASQALLALQNARLVEKILASERLVTVGEVTAGVGHEINNALTYIITNLDFIARQLAVFREAFDGPGRHLDDRELLEKLKRALSEKMLEELQSAARDSSEGAKVIRDIATEIRTVVRPDDSSLRPIDVNDTVRGAVRVVKSQVPPRLIIDMQCAPQVIARGSSARLSQVLINLLINAVQAFSTDSATPRIRITTRVDSSKAYIEVSDNGPGIEGANLHRLFEIFFTTKAAEQGTGLGLAVSRTMMRRQNGDIYVESEVGVGTTFTVWLPLA